MNHAIKKAAKLAVASVALCSGTAWASAVLWYNGNFNNVNGLANEIGSSIAQAKVYDNFIVPTGGWTIDRLWSNNLMNFSTALAQWEVRSGLTTGSGGTLVASGSNAAATRTATGRAGFGLIEYTIEVSGLSLFLAEGEYWLSVTPIGQGGGRAFTSQTSGVGAIGAPSGNDQRAYFNSPSFGASFSSTGAPSLGQPADFSMGVGGVAGAPVNVPEPGSLALVGLALAGLAAARRQRSGARA